MSNIHRVSKAVKKKQNEATEAVEDLKPDITKSPKRSIESRKKQSATMKARKDEKEIQDKKNLVHEKCGQAITMGLVMVNTLMSTMDSVVPIVKEKGGNTYGLETFSLADKEIQTGSNVITAYLAEAFPQVAEHATAGVALIGWVAFTTIPRALFALEAKRMGDENVKAKENIPSKYEVGPDGNL